jgi:Holliday junction DNA helicase RuvB
VRDFANVAGEPVVTAKIADASLTRLEVDRLGLDAMDRRYLTMIADIYRGGPVGVRHWPPGFPNRATRSRMWSSPICSSSA